MTKRALVTGGAGFIGSHLVDRLINEGLEVTVLDNFSTGRPQNLDHHKGNSKLELIQADISDINSIAPFFENVDWVFHLAALADIVPSIEQPMDYYRSNVTGTINVLECAKKNNAKKVIYAASSSCYGIPDNYPTPESAPIQPQYPYALTKRLGEEIVMHWAQIYQLPAISLRFFNVYGPRSRTSGTYGAVFGVFLAQKINEEPYTVVGDGTQSRDFTYVTDVVDAVFTAAKSPLSGEIFNVGSGNHYQVNRLVELLGGEKVHIPKRPGEPDITFADNSKIKEKLNWDPKVTFEDGVQNMLDNIDYWKNAPLWTPDSIEKATETWFKHLS